MWGPGIPGAGIVVGSLDSGVDVSRPDLGPGAGAAGATPGLDPYGQQPVRSGGHDRARHRARWASSWAATRAAPRSGWPGGPPGSRRRSSMTAASATATAIHAAFQWVLDPDANPATDDAPDVLNNSWAYGATGCNLEFQLDLQAVRARGSCPVFAGSNFGPNPSTSASPANDPEALAVGSVDNTGVIDHRVQPRAVRLRRGVDDGYPEVVAPGVSAIRTSDRFGLYQGVSGNIARGAPRCRSARAAPARRTRASPRTSRRPRSERPSASTSGPPARTTLRRRAPRRLRRQRVAGTRDERRRLPPPAPDVTSITPTTGPTAGGTAVTISERLRGGLTPSATVTRPATVSAAEYFGTDLAPSRPAAPSPARSGRRASAWPRRTRFRVERALRGTRGARRRQSYLRRPRPRCHRGLGCRIIGRHEPRQGRAMRPAAWPGARGDERPGGRSQRRGLRRGPGNRTSPLGETTAMRPAPTVGDGPGHGTAVPSTTVSATSATTTVGGLAAGTTRSTSTPGTPATGGPGRRHAPVRPHGAHLTGIGLRASTITTGRKRGSRGERHGRPAPRRPRQRRGRRRTEERTTNITAGTGTAFSGLSATVTTSAGGPP